MAIKKNKLTHFIQLRLFLKINGLYKTLIMSYFILCIRSEKAMLPAGRALWPGGYAQKGAKHAIVCEVGIAAYLLAFLVSAGPTNVLQLNGKTARCPGPKGGENENQKTCTAVKSPAAKSEKLSR
jgi:hypothetical protein